MNDEETKQRRHQLWIDVLTEVERVGFTEEEQQVVLAPMRLRPSKIVEAEGVKYSSPSEWSAAIEHALMQERLFIRNLHEVHGFPDTENMDTVQGHFARLAHLVGKYPEADWDLLMQEQDTAMGRKPSTAKPMQITVQVIERTKMVFLNLYADRKHMMATGNLTELAQVSRTMERKRRVLQNYGVDPDALLSEHETEVEQLIAERANEVAPEDSQPLVLKEQDLFDAATEGKPLPPVAALTVEQGSEAAAVIPVPTPDAVHEPAELVSGASVIGVNEIAQRLGRSPGTIREYLQQSKIPGAIQTGGRWTVNKTAFEKWLEGEPATMPSPREVRKQQPPRPKWDNGDFRPSF